MNYRTLTVIALALGAVGIGQTMAACDQPKPTCAVAIGDFFAQFKLVDGDKTKPCGALEFDTLGLSFYTPSVADKAKPDFDTPARVGIGSADLGTLLDRATDPDSSHSPIALGQFKDNKADASNLCTVPTFAPAIQNLPLAPAIPAKDAMSKPTPAQPAENITYQWSNFRVLFSPDYQGTQFAADLAYTRGGCTAKYNVWAVSPPRDCHLKVRDPKTGKFSAKKPPEPDIDQCRPNAVPEKGIGIGSGISPDYPLVCDPKAFTCVLKSQPPAIDPGWDERIGPPKGPEDLVPPPPPVDSGVPETGGGDAGDAGAKEGGAGGSGGAGGAGGADGGTDATPG